MCFPRSACLRDAFWLPNTKNCFLQNQCYIQEYEVLMPWRTTRPHDSVGPIGRHVDIYKTDPTRKRAKGSKHHQDIKVSYDENRPFIQDIKAPQRDQDRVAHLHQLQHAARYALQRWSLVGLATSASSPTDAANLARSVGWQGKALTSVRSLAKIYFDFGQSVYQGTIEQYAPNIHERLCLCECHHGLNYHDSRRERSE